MSGGGAGARVPGPQQLPGALQGEEGGGQLPGLRGHARVGPVLALIRSMVSSDISKTAPVPQISNVSRNLTHTPTSNFVSRDNPSSVQSVPYRQYCCNLRYKIPLQGFPEVRRMPG